MRTYDYKGYFIYEIEEEQLYIECKETKNQWGKNSFMGYFESEEETKQVIDLLVSGEDKETDYSLTDNDTFFWLFVEEKEKLDSVDYLNGSRA